MRELLTTSLEIAVPTFAVASMFSVGLSHTLAELIEPLRSMRLILAALVANFLFVPALTLVIVWFLPLAEPFRAGLVLLGMAAGAPFLIILIKSAQGNMATSAALLVMLLLVTVLYMPLTAPLFLQGTVVSSSAIAWSLISSMLIPLCIGLLVMQFWQRAVGRLHLIASRIANLALILLIVLMLIVHHSAIMGMFGTGAVLAALLLTAGSFVIGYLLGGPGVDQRGTLGLATSQRNIAAAAIVAAQDFDDPDVLLMVIVTSLVALFVLFPVSWLLRKQNAKLASNSTSRDLRSPLYPIGESR